VSWADALSTAETAAIWWLVPTLLAAGLAKWKILPFWREHRANQKAILTNQQMILGDRFERPHT
jgi:hypothetical protein